MQTVEWNRLPDEVQLAISREALRCATETLASHAELLASEIDDGGLADWGGSDALRMFASVVRATQSDALGPVGHA